MDRSILVMWNSNAGSTDQAQALLEQLKGDARVKIHSPEGDQEAINYVKEAATEFDAVIAAGGDGTVNTTVNGLAASKAESPIMGVLPLGTANDLSFTLSTPPQLERWLALMLDQSIQQDKNFVRPCDIIQTKTKDGVSYFANVATGGNSDRVTEQMTNEIKQQWGALAYLRGALDVLQDLKGFELVVQFDEEEAFDCTAWNVIVANGRACGGHLLVAPQASLEDGLIDVMIIRDGTSIDLASLTAQLFLSDYLLSEQVIYRQVKQFKVSSDPPLRFSADGNLLPESSVSFEIQASRIRVLVGPEYVRKPPKTTRSSAV
ncbi:Diacylglycerol kinase family lipid kinase [Planctomycetales bacterium 10988]|nr:Diacylglycerol kinase family lipid kinase [Planctomycetales bacterium 10988]